MPRISFLSRGLRVKLKKTGMETDERNEILLELWWKKKKTTTKQNKRKPLLLGAVGSPKQTGEMKEADEELIYIWWKEDRTWSQVSSEKRCGTEYWKRSNEVIRIVETGEREHHEKA